MEGEKIEDSLTYKIIGWNEGLSFFREVPMQIYYEGENIGSRRVDFLVENEVMVELKALVRLEDVHLAQGLNYLVAYKLDKGLLLDFGAKSLEIKRLRHPKSKMVSTIP